MHAAQLELHRGHFRPDLRRLEAFSPAVRKRSACSHAGQLLQHSLGLAHGQHPGPEALKLLLHDAPCRRNIREQSQSAEYRERALHRAAKRAASKERLSSLLSRSHQSVRPTLEDRIPAAALRRPWLRTIWAACALQWTLEGDVQAVLWWLFTTARGPRERQGRRIALLTSTSVELCRVSYKYCERVETTLQHNSSGAPDRRPGTKHCT